MSMRIICLVTGFIFGSIPNGYLIARSKGVDIRHTGSGNVGTTNVLRSMGKKYGALTLLLDMAKAIVPIIIMQLFYGDVHETRYITTMYTGLGAVLGHDFSPWLNFNGGIYGTSGSHYRPERYRRKKSCTVSASKNTRILKTAYSKKRTCATIYVLRA